MKIVVAGDSFGLPRGYKHSNGIEIKYEDTYPEQLRILLNKEFKNEDILMLNMSKRYNNSLFLVKRDFQEIYLVQPEYLVIQVGIVDCWTRPEGMHICKEFEGKNPWISENEYIRYMKTFMQKCFQSIQCLKQIILVNITAAEQEQYDKYIGSNERTVSYNNGLKDLRNIDKDRVYICDVHQRFYKEIQKTVCSDGVHPSVYGNSLLAQNIFNLIETHVYFTNAIENPNKFEMEKAIKIIKRSHKTGTIEDKIFYELMRKLIKKYINKKKYQEAMEILLFERMTNGKNLSNNIMLKELFCYIANDMTEQTSLSFQTVEKTYFVLLEELIKIDEIELFNRLVNKYNNQYDCLAYEKYGQLRIKYGLNELATEAYIKAIELKTSNAKAYNYIAKQFVATDNLLDALEFAQIALDLDPNDAETKEIISDINRKTKETS